jgi:hypothetical protein
LGLSVDEELSPAVMRKTVHLASKLSFDSAAQSVAATLEMELTTKRVERLAERIGRERVAQRELCIAEWEALPLVQKLAVPKGIKAPAVAAISTDGGRLQRCDLPDTAKSHWCEDKVGALMELRPNPHVCDPYPQIPDKFLDVVKMNEVTREIKSRVPKGSPFTKSEPASEPAPAAASEAAAPAEPVVAPTDVVAEARAAIVLKPPVIESRDVVASLCDGETFGKHLAARAWLLGFAAALLKAFIADGSSTNWGIWQREFKHQGYVPILDFIHALTYVFAAAMAGRSRAEGSPIYQRWITWVWQGEVLKVIAEVAARAAELGPLPPQAAETDPRQIVADTLTYLTNQQSRMNYPAYRQAGLPITSSPVESTVKQINQRVKGSEKFWCESGGEALLQLRADQLCDTDPLDLFWIHRARQATGIRTYRRQPHAAA